MKNILIAIDFSEVVPEILCALNDLVQGREVSLWFVHVAASDPDFVGYDTGPESERSQVASHLREKHCQLQELAHSWKSPNRKVTALLLQGATAEILCKEAMRLEADCIVIGTHGHSLIRRVFLGSVASGVISRAPCPVVVVPVAKKPV